MSTKIILSSGPRASFPYFQFFLVKPNQQIQIKIQSKSIFQWIETSTKDFQISRTMAFKDIFFDYFQKWPGLLICSKCKGILVKDPLFVGTCKCHVEFCKQCLEILVNEGFYIEEDNVCKEKFANSKSAEDSD